MRGQRSELLLSSIVAIIDQPSGRPLPRLAPPLTKPGAVSSYACTAASASRSRTPEQARMPLLAVPYAPDTAEWLLLSNRRILIDQLRFLQLG